MTNSLRKVFIGAMAVSLLALAGCDNAQVDKAVDSAKQSVTTEQTANKDDQTADAKAAMTKMIVYVPREDGKGVSPQTITVDANRKTVKDALNLMIESDMRHQYPIFEKDTKITGVSMKGNVATIHVTKNFLTNGTGLTATLRLAAIVNTATQFDNVKQVLIQAEGKEIKTYGGVDLTQPIGPMPDSIVK